MLKLLGPSKAFTFPYTLMVIVLIFNLTLYLNILYYTEVKSYDNKINYYNVYILENRALRHVKTTIDSSNVYHLKTEQINYDEGSIFYTYLYDYMLDGYRVEIFVRVLHIIENSVIIYDQLNNLLYYEDRR